MSTAAAALEALDAGENLRAYDLATMALAEQPRDLRLAHAAVLALARSGAVDGAEALFHELGLHVAAEAAPSEGTSSLQVDLLGLYARLAKDRAVHATGDARRRWAAIAADRYEAASKVADSGYAQVNAATMARLSGDRARADARARAALAVVATGADAGVRNAAYWEAATRAEAHALLGELDAAATALGEADRLASDDVGARASTRRQLQLLIDECGAPAQLLERLPVPGVVAFAGHRLACDPEVEAELRDDMDVVLDRYDVKVGYGSLACGADVLWAEALLARGATVHIVLPFDPDEFIETSVRPGGEAWVGRHLAARASAASVTVASDGPYQGHDELYGLATALLLGRARAHAEATTSAARFGVVWDGKASIGPAGTGADAARWQRAGGELDVIAPRGERVPGGSEPSVGPERIVGAALFGDFDGFGRMADAEMPDFVDRVLGAVGTTIDRAGEAVTYRNSWGDGVFVVCRSVSAAANLALEIQASVAASSTDDLPALGLRLAGHAGAMFPLHDPVQGRTTYWGRSVVTAARIEPRTPEGEVYVTEPFAALLALDPTVGIATEYVGNLPTAKGFGDLPMYVLRRRGRVRGRAAWWVP